MKQVVDEYNATLTPPQQALFKRMSDVLLEMVPNVEQGMSYAMPAYKYKGKAVLSILVNKKFMSVYPYSGKVVAKLATQLKGFETTTGSIHFSEDHPIPESLLRAIITARLQEIEERLAA